MALAQHPDERTHQMRTAWLLAVFSILSTAASADPITKAWMARDEVGHPCSLHLESAAGDYVIVRLSASRSPSLSFIIFGATEAAVWAYDANGLADFSALREEGAIVGTTKVTLSNAATEAIHISELTPESAVLLDANDPANVKSAVSSFGDGLLSFGRLGSYSGFEHVGSEFMTCAAPIVDLSLDL